MGTINIQRLNVFSKKEAARGAVYQLADRLHSETRPSFVRSLLLFKEGDLYSPEKLAETERNLRALGFLKSAQVVAGPPHDGLVDVTVTTQDAWSLEPGSEAGNKGGVSTFGVSLTDTNLAGLGRQLSVSYNKGVDRSRTAIDYRDPSFIRPYWRARATYAQNSDGFERAVSVVRPFYSFSTPWAVELSYVNLRQTDRLFFDSRRFDQFRQQHREAIASYGIALRPNESQASRFSFGLHLIKDDFGQAKLGPKGPLPDNRDFHYLFGRFEYATNSFVSMNYVNRDLRVEDFDLGARLSLETAVSPEGLGPPVSTGFVRLSASRGFSFDERSFAIPMIGFETRLQHGLQNAIASTSTRYVRRFDTAYPQAVVGRVLFTDGYRLDRDVQFFADGGDGLRGYRLHSFEGDKNFIVNVEHRVYLGRELLQLVSPGIAVFIDSGNATNAGLRHLLALKTDVGIGIRIGLPRTPKNLLRLDIALPLDRDVRGRRKPIISFSSGQAF